MMWLIEHWAFLLGVIGLAINTVLSSWDDVHKLGEKASDIPDHSRFRLKRKVVLALISLAIAVSAFWQADDSSERQRKQLSGKLDAANDAITNLTTKLDTANGSIESLKEQVEQAMASAASNAALAGRQYSALVDARLNAAKDKERLFQTFSTSKFDLQKAREELTNRFDRIRWEEERRRMDAQLAEPAAKAAEEKARQEQQEAALKQKEASLDEFAPYVEDALTFLRSMLRDALEGTAVTNLNWNCQDVRELVANNDKCQIKIGDNSPWTYHANVRMFRPAGRNMMMQIICMSSTNNPVSYRNTLDLNWYPPYRVVIKFSALRGQMTHSEQVNLPDSTNAVRAYLRHMIAAHPDIR